MNASETVLRFLELINERNADKLARSFRRVSSSDSKAMDMPDSH